MIKSNQLNLSQNIAFKILFLITIFITTLSIGCSSSNIKENAIAKERRDKTNFLNCTPYPHAVVFADTEILSIPPKFFSVVGKNVQFVGHYDIENDSIDDPYFIIPNKGPFKKETDSCIELYSFALSSYSVQKAKDSQELLPAHSKFVIEYKVNVQKSVWVKNDKNDYALESTTQETLSKHLIVTSNALKIKENQ